MTNILITGAGSGLGRALAFQFANVNTTLVLLDVSEMGLEDTTQSLKDSGARVYSFVVDIGEARSLTHCLKNISSTISHIDWIVNCAGMTLTSRAIDITPQQWQQIISVNVLGVTTITNHFLPEMIERQSGKVINISSMFGVLPAPSGIAYATSKHAMVGYTKTLMIELQDTGVSVHLVCPGFIQTSLFDNATYIGVDKDKLLPDTNSMMTAQEAAQKIQKGIDGDRQWIIFPFYVRLLWWLEWIFPSIARHLWIKQWKSFVQKSRP